MAYEINRHQAERLSFALDGFRAATDRYIAQMETLLAEALDEEARDGAHLHDALADATAAVGAHYEIKSPTRFFRRSAAQALAA